jgi:hypothetical protein
MTCVTVDYDGEQAAPEPASAAIARFLRRSFSIADALKGALRGWLFGLIGMVLGAVFGVYSIWSTPPTYTVSIGLLPTDSSGDVSVGDSGGGGALGALAGLLGMGGGPIPKFTRFVASLNATAVAKIMDQKYDMVCRTFACDPKTHIWRKSTGLQADFNRVMAQIAHLPDPDSPRTALDLANYTAAEVTIASDRTTHILTLSMDSKKPQDAVRYLNVLVQATNDFIREKDRSIIQLYVDYLHQKLATTNLNLAQHDALASLMVDQERKLMLSSVDVPYAASVQDGPNITMSNKALRMLAVDIMLGLVLGFVIGWIWNWRANSRETRSQSWKPY